MYRNQLIKESEVERFYQEYLKQGYYKQWARVKAENKFKENVDRSHSITVLEPGIGNVQYTGD